MSAHSASKIVCVGRNYAAHAKEMGNDVPDRPLIFLKPPSALIADGETIRLPAESERVEHEGEIGVVIGKRASHVTESEAMEHVAGFVPLNDVTARDLQMIDSQWTRAKGFDTFCPVGSLIPKDGIDWRGIEVVCTVNGEVRQRATADRMVFGIPFLVSYISAIMSLEPGDVIATGTPEGVSPLNDGDIVRVELTGLGAVENPVRGAAAETR